MALWLAGTACRAPVPELGTLSEADLAAVEGLATAHFEAVLEGDADSVAALYAEDAVQLPPNRPVVEGRQAIRAALEAGRETFLDRVSFWGLRSSPDGQADGLVYDWGSYWLTVSGDSTAQQVAYAGKYLVLLRKQPDGSWLIAREAWTADLPTP